MSIDPNAIKKFARMAGPELALQLVDRFLTECQERLGKAQEGLAAGSLKPTEEHCHRLASDAGWLGCREFQALCSQTECLAVDGHTEQVGPALAKLQELSGPLLEELPKYRAALAEGRDPCDCA